MTTRLSVVIPAYRVPDLVGSTVTRLRDVLGEESGGVEIVVVDDGSADGTDVAAWTAGADQVIVQPVNRGKGAAVRAGMLAARGATIAFTDVDLAYAPEQITRLQAEVEAGHPMVVGNRHHVETTTLVRARRLREVSGRLFSALTRVVVLGETRDTQCGLKAFSADTARALFSRARVDGFAFDVELFVIARRLGIPVVEVAVEVANSDLSTVSVGSDAWPMMGDLLRIRRLARAGAYTATVTSTID